MYKGLEVVKLQVDASVLCQYFTRRIEERHKTLKDDGGREIEI